MCLRCGEGWGDWVDLGWVLTEFCVYCRWGLRMGILLRCIRSRLVVAEVEVNRVRGSTVWAEEGGSLLRRICVVE